MANQWFARQLKIALTSLYDPTVLRTSALIDLLGMAQRHDPVAGLRSALVDSIEALRPGHSTPQGSRAWRAYQILRRRYTEGLGQRQLASDLGLGIRQLQREEKLAREMLAEQLWLAYDLESKLPADAFCESDEEQEPPGSSNDSVQEELEWLRSSVPVQPTDICDLIRDILTIVEPLTRKSQVTVACLLPEANQAPLRAPILRQALLDIVTTAIGYVPGGLLHIDAHCSARRIDIQLRAFAGQAAVINRPSGAKSLSMAEHLIQLCDGSLLLAAFETASEHGPAAFSATISLQLPVQTPVLVIEDNADSLQLIQRYLADSPYLFVGAQDGRRGLELAREYCPRAVLLDIMMPAQDGWAVLGQLREHQETSHIPVIVCTLLSQRDLAMALGAAGFLQKPINRTELLFVLQQLVAGSGAGPGLGLGLDLDQGLNVRQ